MTITATYDTTGAKVFSFHTNLYSEGKYIKTVNNTEYKKMDVALPLESFNGNEIVIFEGNDDGYFLTIMHEDEPVRLLESFLSMEELQAFLKNERGNCNDFNWALSTNDMFYTYYLLNHTLNHSNPREPHFHLLIKESKSIEHFRSIHDSYESLYEKYRKIESHRCFEMLTESLTAEELSLLKFSVFCNTGDVCLCGSWREMFVKNLDNIEIDAFEIFGISDEIINRYFQRLKMSPHYFISRIQRGDEQNCPSVFYVDDRVESYLDPEDEVKLWRSGRQFREYLAKNYDYIVDMSEPPDRG